jgi:hypothetical protein
MSFESIDNIMDNDQDNWIDIINQNYNNHFKNFQDIWFYNSENRSFKDKVKLHSGEFECVLSIDFLNSSFIQNLKRAGKFTIKSEVNGCSNGDGSLSTSNYLIQRSNETFDLRDRLSEYQLDEYTLNKLGINEFITITKKMYSDGELAGDFNGSTSQHIHNSYSNKISRAKLHSPSFYRLVLDFFDYFSASHRLNKYHAMNYRSKGTMHRSTDYSMYCKRGFNEKIQMGFRSSHYDNCRYFHINYCENERSHETNKKFGTIENRHSPIFRDFELCRSYNMGYYHIMNQFLIFYKDVSVNDLYTNDLYKRVNNKIHINKELIIANNYNTEQMSLDNDILFQAGDLSLAEKRDQFIRGDM